MKVKDLVKKLEGIPEDYDIEWDMFGVVEAANERGAYTSKEIRSGTYYKWFTHNEPLRIVDHDNKELVLYISKTK